MLDRELFNKTRNEHKKKMRKMQRLGILGSTIAIILYLGLCGFFVWVVVKLLIFFGVV